MDEVFSKLLDRVLVEKEIINRLIMIDNERNHSNITFTEFYDNLKKIIEEKNDDVILCDTLFITEGEPYLTVKILKQLNSDNEYVIYINQGFVGLNEWLITRFKQFTNINVSLDTDINYNKYIVTTKYKVLPVGEEGLIEQVNADFKEE